MAVRAVATYIKYHAWNASTNVPVVGDAGNHTLRWIKDNVSSAPTSGVPSEVDSNNAAGVYIQFLTSGDADCIAGKLAGKSSTANVNIFGPSVFFQYAPQSAPGSPGGMLIDGTNVGLVTLQGGLTISGAPINANLQQINGISNPASGAHVGVDWGQTVTPGATVNLSATTIATVTNSVTVSGTVTANVTQFKGISSPASGGYVGVDWGQIVNQTTVVGLTNTTVNASAVVSGTVPANLVQINGISNPASGAHVGIDWGQIVNPLTTVNLTNTTVNASATVSGTVPANLVQIQGLSLPSSGASVPVDWSQIVNPTATVNLTNTTISSVSSGIQSANVVQWAGAGTAGSNLAVVNRAQAGSNMSGSSATTAILSGASASDGVYVGSTIYLTGGGGAGQSQTVLSYTGATRTAVVNGWGSVPTNTTTWTILPGGITFNPATTSVTVSGSVTVGTNNDKTGYTVSQIVSGAITTTVFAVGAITAAVTDTTFDNAIADALLDRINGIETSMTPRQALRIIGASAAGVLSGATTATININGMGVGTQRISASVDQSGNRTAISLTP